MYDVYCVSIRDGNVHFFQGFCFRFGQVRYAPVKGDSGQIVQNAASRDVVPFPYRSLVGVDVHKPCECAVNHELLLKERGNDNRADGLDVRVDLKNVE